MAEIRLFSKKIALECFVGTNTESISKIILETALSLRTAGSLSRTFVPARLVGDSGLKVTLNYELVLIEVIPEQNDMRKVINSSTTVV